MRRVFVLAALILAPAAHAQQDLTPQETAAFGAQVARCWNVGSITGQKAVPVVTVGFRLDRKGKPQRDSFVLVGAGKDTSDAVKSAYTAAKRAIIRCGAKGYELPLEKYDVWRNTELTFNPERMSLR